MTETELDLERIAKDVRDIRRYFPQEREEWWELSKVSAQQITPKGRSFHFSVDADRMFAAYCRPGFDQYETIHLVIKPDGMELRMEVKQQNEHPVQFRTLTLEDQGFAEKRCTEGYKQTADTAKFVDKMLWMTEKTLDAFYAW